MSYKCDKCQEELNFEDEMVFLDGFDNVLTMDEFELIRPKKQLCIECYNK